MLVVTSPDLNFDITNNYFKSNINIIVTYVRQHWSGQSES